MRIVHCLPAEPLRAIVDRYWCWEGEKALRLLPLMPSPGGLEIFFHYRVPFALRDGVSLRTLPQAHVACVRTRPVGLFQQGGVGFIAVRVRAGMGEALTGWPVADFADAFFDATDVWGRAARLLLEELASAPSPRERAVLLDRFFLARLRHPRRGASLDSAITPLLHGQARIADVASDVGLGQRRLEQRFRDATGLTPARFRRLARLRRSIRTLLLSPPGPSLTALVDPAYHDQAQQVREFRELTGFTPGELRRAAADVSHFYNRPWSG